MLSKLTGRVVELTQEGVEASSPASMKASNTRCRNLALNRIAWLQKCKEVAEKVEEAKIYETKFNNLN